jgi:hypothetical protein
MAAAAALGLGALGAPFGEPWLRAKAEGHYLRAVGTAGNEGLDAASALARADRQVRAAVDHLPRVLGRTAFELMTLAALAVLAQRGKVPWRVARWGLLALTVAELFRAGYGLNPAIDRGDDRPVPAVVARLRERVGTTGRVLGLGQELLPNVAMRYGLSDPRNYDSVELARNLDWLAPLYEPDGRGRSSRRTVGWNGVLRARGRLRGASVAAVVAAAEPPEEFGARAERVGSVWIAYPDAEPLVTVEPAGAAGPWTVDDGRIDVVVKCKHDSLLVIRQTYDPGWVARVDGRPAGVAPYRGTFLAVRLTGGRHRVTLEYDPPEVRAACAASLAGLGAALAALVGPGAVGAGRFQGRGLGRRRAARLESIP